jgi:hypothetical protein
LQKCKTFLAKKKPKTTGFPLTAILRRSLKERKTSFSAGAETPCESEWPEFHNASVPEGRPIRVPSPAKNLRILKNTGFGVCFYIL